MASKNVSHFADKIQVPAHLRRLECRAYMLKHYALCYKFHQANWSGDGFSRWWPRSSVGSTLDLLRLVAKVDKAWGPDSRLRLPGLLLSCSTSISMWSEAKKVCKQIMLLGHNLYVRSTGPISACQTRNLEAPYLTRLSSCLRGSNSLLNYFPWCCGLRNRWNGGLIVWWARWGGVLAD